MNILLGKRVGELVTCPCRHVLIPETKHPISQPQDTILIKLALLVDDVGLEAKINVDGLMPSSRLMHNLILGEARSGASQCWEVKILIIVMSDSMRRKMRDERVLVVNRKGSDGNIIRTLGRLFELTHPILALDILPVGLRLDGRGASRGEGSGSSRS